MLVNYQTSPFPLVSYFMSFPMSRLEHCSVVFVSVTIMISFLSFKIFIYIKTDLDLGMSERPNFVSPNGWPVAETQLIK